MGLPGSTWVYLGLLGSTLVYLDLIEWHRTVGWVMDGMDLRVVGGIEHLTVLIIISNGPKSLLTDRQTPTHPKLDLLIFVVVEPFPDSNSIYSYITKHT